MVNEKLSFNALEHTREVCPMSIKEISNNFIAVPEILKYVGYIGGTLGILTVLVSIMVYLPKHPDFSFFTTYLSDIGDTAGWPQIIFNTGTLLSAPIRYLFIILFVIRLSHMGAGRTFSIALFRIDRSALTVLPLLSCIAS